MVRRMKPRGKIWPFFLLLPALQGCAPTSLNPIDWYHDLEGGAIAEQRPPPPQVDAPYPNLAAVPQRPPPLDPATRGKIATGLVADRTNAQYAAGLNPLVAPSPSVRPVTPPPRPSGDETSGATMPAAAGPPAKIGPLGPPQPALPNTPSTPPRKAPTSPVQSASLEAPKRGSVDVPPGEGQPATALASLPTIPDAPPPPPNFSGMAATTSPTPAPATPPPQPAPAPIPAAPGAPVLVAFPPGSATLPVESLGALKVLSRQRGASTVAVTGYGDTIGTEANAQASALPLALARARAIAANLLASGVPSSSIRVNAEAQGHGGAARLLN